MIDFENLKNVKKSMESLRNYIADSEEDVPKELVAAYLDLTFHVSYYNSYMHALDQISKMDNIDAVHNIVKGLCQEPTSFYHHVSCCDDCEETGECCEGDD